MRIIRAAVLAACAAGAVQAGTSTMGTETGWHYGLPDTGILPSYGKFEWFTRMGERHGRGSELSLESYALTLPFSDPRRTGWGNTMVNVQFDSKITVANTGGSLDLAHSTLYNFALPVIFITTEPNGNYWTYGVAPELASDCDAVRTGMDLTGFVMYTIKYSESFTYSVGLATSPRFAEYFAVPVVNFTWKPSQDWTVRLKGYQLEAMYQATDRLAIGPFVASRGGIWAVNTERGDRIFRVRSLVVGAGMEYDFSEPGQTKRIITAAVGSTLTTNAQFLERNAGKDAWESHHYRPALYVSFGVDFRF